MSVFFWRKDDLTDESTMGIPSGIDVARRQPARVTPGDAHGWSSAHRRGSRSPCRPHPLPQSGPVATVAVVAREYGIALSALNQMQADQRESKYLRDRPCPS